MLLFRVDNTLGNGICFILKMVVKEELMDPLRISKLAYLRDYISTLNLPNSFGDANDFHQFCSAIIDTGRKRVVLNKTLITVEEHKCMSFGVHDPYRVTIPEYAPLELTVREGALYKAIFRTRAKTFEFEVTTINFTTTYDLDEVNAAIDFYMKYKEVFDG